jgi:hypothetical protein
MTLNDYAKKQFIVDINGLQLKSPNPTILRIDGRADVHTRFFGGMEWANYALDIANVKDENRKYFCLCLFAMVSADQNMFANHNSHYNAFRKTFTYPKFGWTGYGMHFEKPSYILSISDKAGVDFSSISTEELNEFVFDQFKNAKLFLPKSLPVWDFFKDMINDVDFKSDTAIFKRLVDAMFDNSKHAF